jgi:hypothetical protein
MEASEVNTYYINANISKISCHGMQGEGAVWYAKCMLYDANDAAWLISEVCNYIHV